MMNKNKIFEAIEETYKEMEVKDSIIKFIEDKAHEKLEEASLERDYIERMLEDLEYEKAISTLNSLIESLEGGYCTILNKIEGKI